MPQTDDLGSKQVREVCAAAMPVEQTTATAGCLRCTLFQMARCAIEESGTALFRSIGAVSVSVSVFPVEPPLFDSYRRTSTNVTMPLPAEGPEDSLLVLSDGVCLAAIADRKDALPEPAVLVVRSGNPNPGATSVCRAKTLCLNGNSGQSLSRLLEQSDPGSLLRLRISNSYGQLPDVLLQRFTRLRHLEIQHCKGEVALNWRAFPDLESLSIQWSRSPENALGIASSCNLERLCLYGCAAVREMDSIAKLCRERGLSLTGAKWIPWLTACTGGSVHGPV